MGQPPPTAEHAAAMDRALRIRDYFLAQGAGEPLMADSGNGAHLLCRVDLPAEDGGLQTQENVADDQTQLASYLQQLQWDTQMKRSSYSIQSDQYWVNWWSAKLGDDYNALSSASQAVQGFCY